MLGSILDLSLEELGQLVKQVLENLYNLDQLPQNPLLDSLFLRDFCRRHPEMKFPSPTEFLEPAIREILYQDVIPQTQYAKVDEVRAGIVIAVTYFHFQGLLPPRQSYRVADDLLYEEESFRTIVPVTYSKKIMEELLPQGGIPEPTFRRALMVGRKRLAEAIIARERRLSQAEPIAEPGQTASTLEAQMPLELPLTWLPTFRQRQSQKIGQMLRADGSIMAWERAFLPRHVTLVQTDAPSTGKPTWEEALAKVQKIVLVGPPGCGKTTALRRAAIGELCQQKTVVWMSLLEYATSAWDTNIRDFIFKSEIEPSCGTAQEITKVRSEQTWLEHSGQLVYYLDDWDRLPDEIKPIVAERIRTLPSYRMALWQTDGRIATDEYGLWSLAPLTDLELYRLVRLLLAGAEHREGLLETVTEMLDREIEFRKAAQNMPLLIDICCGQAKAKKVTVMQVIQEAILHLLRRTAPPEGTTAEKTYEALAFALYRLDTDCSRPVERQFFSRMDIKHVWQVRYNLAPETTLAHALQSGLLLLDTPSVYCFSSKVFRDVLLGAFLIQEPSWYYITRRLSHNHTEISATLRYMAASAVEQNFFDKFVNAMARAQPATGLGWVWAGGVLCEARRAGYLFPELERAILSRVSASTQEDTGIAMRVTQARLLGCLGCSESADEFVSIVTDTHCDACEREVAARCLSGFPGESVADHLVNVVLQEAPYRLKQAALQALLEMPGEAGCTAMASLVRQGTETTRLLAAQAMLRSGRWKTKVMQGILCTEPEVEMLIKQAKQLLSQQETDRVELDPAEMTPSVFDQLLIDLKAPDPETRVAAVYKLGQIAAVPPRQKWSKTETKLFFKLFRKEEDLTRQGVLPRRARGWLAFAHLVSAASSDVSMRIRVTATEGLAKPECREALLNIDPPFLPPLWTLELGIRLDTFDGRD